MTHEPHKLSILIIDDEPGDAELHARIIAAAGYHVETAETLYQARAKIADHSFAVLLVDLRLPDGDGLQLLEPARANDPHTVAVVITAFTSVESAVAAIKAGAYDFLTKPTPSEKLVSTIHRAAERYYLAKSLAERTDELKSTNEHLDQRVKDATEEIFELNERLRRYVGQLVETNNHQTHYLEDMAHELKNPLAVVMGYASYLTSSPIETFEKREIEKCLDAVQENSKHLHALIEELLDSTRLASRKITIKPIRLSGAKALTDAVHGMRFKAEERGITITLNLPAGDKLTMAADPNRLKQIINNLITNAVKFTPSGGTIAVSGRLRGKKIEVTVSDTGCGMSENQVERIFDRFYQVFGPKNGSNRGLGLGLNIVQGLVKLHGGRIWAQSEEGRGSKFYFTMPTSLSGIPSGSVEYEDVPAPIQN
ncbi:MAG: hypothetical protein COB53_00565 [Elusimicrobia bacterium]|nr:MAG: hypothetical protein COB53_00565 [Elusimicrobiota bacterium]